MNSFGYYPQKYRWLISFGKSRSFGNGEQFDDLIAVLAPGRPGNATQRGFHRVSQVKFDMSGNHLVFPFFMPAWLSNSTGV
jgi:hypothetical protein